MNGERPGGPVSRATFDRERRARDEAEARLEDQARELLATNRRLMSESEALRAALAESEALRAREAAALRAQEILSQALASLSGKAGAAEAMAALLHTLCTAYGGVDACLLQVRGTDVCVAAAVRPEEVGLRLPVPATLLSRPRRMGGLGALAGGAPIPGHAGRYASALVAPLRMTDEKISALMLGSPAAGQFSASDLRVLEQVAELAAQSLAALREARRNALLVSLIEGRSIGQQDGILDAPLEAVHRAFARLTDLQGAVAGVLDDLLGTPLEEIDAAIDRALFGLGTTTGVDRVWVARPCEDAPPLATTHAWTRSGHGPAHGTDGLPWDRLTPWCAELQAGRDVTIPDVSALPDDAEEKAVLRAFGIVSLLAVPMVEDGAFRGVVALAASGATRRFLPGEVHLIRSVARVSATLLARREQTARIERLSEIARRTSNLVVMTDAQRRITWINAACEATSGWRLDEIRGQDAAGFLHCADSDPESVAALERALAAGAPMQAEILNRARDGRRYWVALDVQPMRSADGRLDGFMAVQTDVTERRRQRDALNAAAAESARARATLAAAVEALQDGFVLFDAEDRLVLCNARYRAIYPRSAAAMVPGASFEEILRYGLARGEYADTDGREEAWLAERLARHRESDSEIEQELSDGRWLRIFEKATPDGGRVGLRVDITALKLAERRALDARAAAMEASSDGISITDGEGRFVYMNRAHLAQFGYTSEAEVIGQPWTMLYAPEAAAWMQAHAMPELLRTGKWSGEIMGTARDGSAVDQEVSLTLQPAGGILCITRDMQDRRRATAERDRLREELQLAQRREVVGQMAAGLAHDFNNLLAAISGGALLISDASAPGSPAAISAQRIQTATDRAGELVQRLLSLGRRGADPVALDLRQPLREAADLVRASLRAPSRLELALPDAPVEVTADPTDVLQTVLNLAINARDALQEGGGRIRIALEPPVALARDADVAVGLPDPGRRYWRIIVSDTGAGMSPEVVARAFTPYETTKGDHGTGLGLSVVSSVVMSAGGAVQVDTAPGRGTTFTILWPEAPRPPPAPARPEGLTGRLDGRTVLIVDDHEELLAILAEFLEAAGAEVAPTSAPREALEALRDDPDGWDLLITDFDMPDMTGTELARMARSHAPRIPLVLVTALAGIAGRDTGLFETVLGKPVDKDALVRAAEVAILRAEEPKG